MIKMSTYYCEKCSKNHRENSKIGQDHIEYQTFEDEIEESISFDDVMDLDDVSMEYEEIEIEEITVNNEPDYNSPKAMDSKQLYQALKNNEEVTTENIQEIQNVICQLVGIESLAYPLRKRQIQAIISFICFKKDISAFLPTSYGKTIVAIICGLYMKRIFNKRTIIIGLLKALSAEHYETFGKYAPTLISDGDHSTKTSEFDGEWTFCVLTPEKFDNSISNSKTRDSLLNNVGLIVSDEAHTIGDISRGYRMENYIITAKRLDEIYGTTVRHIFLSATVGNQEEFSNWNQMDLISALPSERPVPLKQQIIGYDEVFFSWNRSIPDVKANYNRRIQILREIMRSNPNKNWIIFTTSRARTKSVAYDILGMRNRVDLKVLVERYGIGFHNAGLTKSERNMVEEAFKDGKIKIIVSTPTLAVGVNLPADCTVLFDVEQFSMIHGTEILDANRIQQTKGRAGRAGLSDYGYAYIISPNRIINEVTDRCNNPLIVKSSLKARLHQAILKWFVAGLGYTIDGIIETAKFAYANIEKQDILNAINFLKVFNFIKEETNGTLTLN